MIIFLFFLSYYVHYFCQKTRHRSYNNDRINLLKRILVKFAPRSFFIIIILVNQFTLYLLFWHVWTGSQFTALYKCKFKMISFHRIKKFKKKHYAITFCIQGVVLCLIQCSDCSVKASFLVFFLVYPYLHRHKKKYRTLCCVGIDIHCVIHIENM